MNQIIPRCSSKCALYLAAFATLLFAFSLPALGQIAEPGYDLFQTGSGTSVDLGGNIGTINLQGVPIQTSVTGNADTIIYRPDAIVTSGVAYPLSVFALFMKSTSTITYDNQQCDVYVTINASGNNTSSPTYISPSVLPQYDTLTASTGTITVYTSNSTFDSTITVYADVIIVPTGANPANSSSVLYHQAETTGITMSQQGSSYSTTAPAGSPNAMVPGEPLLPGAHNAASSSSSSTSFPSGGIYPSPVHKGHTVVPAQNCTPLNSPVGPSGATKPLGGSNELRTCPASPTNPTGTL